MNKKRSALLITVVIVTAILIVVNLLVNSAGFLNPHIDLTEKKLYTLSDGTKRILSNIKADEPVTIRFYATGDSRLMTSANFPAQYTQTVEDLLLEIEKASNDKVSLQRIDPRPDTDAEDKAVSDDVLGQQVNQLGDKIYFGLAVECGDRKQVIPFLDPGAETSLEYDVARAIAKVNQVKKPIIGVMSAMPIAGPAMNFPGMRQQQPPPWLVIQQLRQDYEVREIPVTADKIDADIGILLMVHPADIRPITEYAVDQFVLRGGKVVAFVDPKSVVSNVYNQQQNNPMMGMQAPTVPASSTLKSLFKAWGINFESEMVVADMTDATQNVPVLLSIGSKDGGIDRTLPITAQLEQIQMYDGGSLGIEKKDGIKAVTLLQSTENSMMIDSAAADKAMRPPMDNFHSEGRRHILGVQLTGHFKTAFPDGAPPNEPVNPPGGSPGMMPPGAFAPRVTPHGSGGSETDAGAPAKKEENPASAPAPATAPAPVVAPAAPTPAAAPAPASAVAPAAPAPAAAAPAPPKPAEAAKPSGPPSLKESTNNEGVVFVFSDADMLYDRVIFQMDQMGRPSGMLNHNMVLLLNIVEMLNGGNDLISVRSRGATRRPFTKFQQMSEAVAARFRPQLEELTKKRNDAEQEASKIKSLELKLDKNGQLDIADPAKKQKLKELNDTQVGLAKQLRDLRKQENREKDHLETMITIMNFLVPVLVIIFGIVLAVRRRSLQAAH